MVLFVVERNTAFDAIEHLTSINGSPCSLLLKDLTSNYSKCCALGKNVLDDEDLQNHVTGMQKRHFPLIIDESNGVASTNGVASVSNLCKICHWF